MKLNVSFRPARFLRFAFVKANGETRYATARRFGDKTPFYYRAYKADKTRRNPDARVSTAREPSYYGNVRFVDARLYNRALRELLDAYGYGSLSEIPEDKLSDVTLLKSETERTPNRANRDGSYSYTVTVYPEGYTLRLRDLIRARAIDNSLRAFKSERLTEAPDSLREFADAIDAAAVK